MIYPLLYTSPRNGFPCLFGIYVASHGALWSNSFKKLATKGRPIQIGSTDRKPNEINITQDVWEGSIPHDDGRKVTHDDNHDRLQNVCTDAALSYGAGILQKTSPCYFLKKTIDMQQHDEAINDIIENLEYGNMLVAENKC